MIKLFLIVRKDLKMRRGKEIAQGGHAVEQWMLRANESNDGFSNEEKEYLNSGTTKITLRVDSEEELLSIMNEAQEAGLNTHLITDLGKTEFNGVSTNTVLSIGPHHVDKVNPITNKLKLY